jgi:hypothetical protein
MGLFDNLKDQLSNAVGVDLDTDKFVEASGQVAEVSQNVADTAEAIREAKDTFSGE